MNLRKVFSIVIASIALFLFINMFFPYNGLVNEYNDIAIIDGNMWSFSVAFSIFALISIILIITLHLLYIFGVLKSDWVLYANFGVGFVAFFHMSFVFLVISSAHVGAWLGLFFSAALLVLSVLWGKLSEKPFSGGEKKGKIIEYDPETGKPIYAKPKGYDPKTGEPVYE